MISGGFPTEYAGVGFHPKGVVVGNYLIYLQNLFSLQVCFRLVNIRATVRRTTQEDNPTMFKYAVTLLYEEYEHAVSEATNFDQLP